MIRVMSRASTVMAERDFVAETWPNTLDVAESLAGDFLGR